MRAPLCIDRIRNLLAVEMAARFLDGLVSVVVVVRPTFAGGNFRFFFRFHLNEVIRLGKLCLSIATWFLF